MKDVQYAPGYFHKLCNQFFLPVRYIGVITKADIMGLFRKFLESKYVRKNNNCDETLALYSVKSVELPNQEYTCMKAAAAVYFYNTPKPEPYLSKAIVFLDFLSAYDDISEAVHPNIFTDGSAFWYLNDLNAVQGTVGEYIRSLQRELPGDNQVMKGYFDFLNAYSAKEDEASYRNFCLLFEEYYFKYKKGG